MPPKQVIDSAVALALVLNISDEWENVEQVVTNSKDIVADLTPGVWIPDKKVLDEWDSEEYNEKMKNSWKPSNC